jgi:hypothetical protein
VNAQGHVLDFYQKALGFIVRFSNVVVFGYCGWVELFQFAALGLLITCICGKRLENDVTCCKVLLFDCQPAVSREQLLRVHELYMGCSRIRMLDCEIRNYINGPNQDLALAALLWQMPSTNKYKLNLQYVT